MKHIFSALIALFLVATSLQAAIVKGKILDTNNKPLDYVNVVLLRQTNNALAGGGITDVDGLFSIDNITVGTYRLEVSFVGYKTYTKPIVIKSPEDKLTVGAIKLEEDAQALSEVEVVAQGSQMRFDIDKKVFNVDQNIAAAGASASEVLENIPSVQVDNDGNISLRNNSNVEIWINGKPSGLDSENRAQILEQMPAGSIESIEVITNPSAKFSPEGTAGIINLVMKKERKSGYIGSVSAGASYQMNGKLSGNASANFNYNSSKIDFYANLGFRQRDRVGTGYTDRYSFAPNTNRGDTLSFMHQDNDLIRSSWGLFGRTGLSWHINKKNTIGISGMFNTQDNNNYSVIDYDIIRFTTLDTARYKHFSDVDAARISYNVTLDYLYEIDKKGSEIRSSITYGGNQRDQDANYNQTVEYGDASAYTQKQYSGYNNHTAEFKSDYVQKFSDNMKLEAGVAVNWQDRFSNSKTWDYPTPTTDTLSAYNDFEYKELISAAYATYGAKFGNFSFQGGLRGEYTNTIVSTRDAATDNYLTTTKGYFQLFPTAYLSYALPEGNELQLNYTRRVNRPRGRELSAYRNVSDSTNISYGNPRLSPEFANALELNYIKSWEEHVLSASLYYRYTTDVIQQVRFESPLNNDIMETTYENIASAQSAGVEVVGKNHIGKWLNLTTTLNAYYEDMSPIVYNNILLQGKSEGFSWDARLMANVLISKTFSGQLTGAYYSPHVIAQGKTKDFYMVDLGFKKSFFEKTVNLSLSIRDVLNSRGWRNITWGDTFYQDFERAPNGPRFSLTATYNFGNMKDKKKAKSKEENGTNGSENSSEEFME